MAIAKMERISIDGHIDQLDQALLECVKSGCFHPEIPYANVPSNGEILQDINPYESLLQKILEVSSRADVDVTLLERNKMNPLDLGNIDGLENKIAEIRRKDDEIVAMIRKNEEVTLSKRDIFQSNLLRFRIGRLPVGNKKALLSSLPDSCLHMEFQVKKESYLFCAYITSVSKVEEIDTIYAKYNFDRILVPHDILESPKVVREYMQAMGDLDHFNVNEATIYMDKINNRLLSLIRKKNRIEDQLNENEQTLQQIGYIQNMDITFDELFASEFIDIRFGRLPRDSYPKLEFYAEQNFLFESFYEDKGYYWGVYFVPTPYKKEIDELFTSLHFERIRIPSIAHKTPEETIRLLEKAVQIEHEKLSEVEEEISRLEHKIKLYLFWTYARVKYLYDSFNLRKYVRIYGQVFHMEGYVPEESAALFKKILNQSSAAFLAFSDKDVETTENQPEITIKEEEASVDATETPPTKLVNTWFSKPFEMFTDMYGLPAYNEFDPTSFIAVTYTILFGIMFGDLGQGLCVFGLGLYLWKTRKIKLGAIMTRLGISGAIFGLVYGEVFGNDSILEPLYGVLNVKELPYRALEDTNTILIFSIVLGVILIFGSMLINIGIGIRQKNWERAIFSQNGFAGLLFYGTAIVTLVTFVLVGEMIVPMWLMIFGLVIPFFMMYFKKVLAQWVSRKGIHLEESIGDYILEGFFEMFEVLLSFLSNTVSFLRVGGFVLSHAGMMLVVAQIANMMSGSGIIALVLGNIFVMALEGLLVGIQGLRLEFYELFSHFTGEPGKAFEPIKMSGNSSQE